MQLSHLDRNSDISFYEGHDLSTSMKLHICTQYPNMTSCLETQNMYLTQVATHHTREDGIGERFYWARVVRVS